MRGRDHDPAGSAVALHGERQRRRRQVVGADARLQAVCGQHAGCLQREVPRHEARVVADQHEPASTLDHVLGVGARCPPDVGERETVGDEVAPTVGPESDVHARFSRHRCGRERLSRVVVDSAS